MTTKISVLLSVSQLNNQANYILEKEFSNITVIGEISSLKRYPSGYTYLTIKDSISELNCIIFPNTKNVEKLKIGLEAHFTGTLAIYTPKGNFQLIINSFEEKQDGIIWKKYIELKNKLSNEGLFDQRYKRKISKYPFNIGIVSSSEGAVIHDITSIFKINAAHIKLHLIPCKIQGSGSVEQIIKAIEAFNNYNNVDIIIIARGGGSFEDLNSFNDEKLARIIFKSETPIITAIGHETDFTIVDFVSDLRASTPSLSAQIVTEPSKDLLPEINNYKNLIKHSLERRIEFFNNENKHLKSHLSIDYISEIINRVINEKKNIDKILSINVKNRLTYLFKILSQYNKRIESNKLNNILKKGFALVLDKKGNIIQEAKKIKLSDKICVNFSDGKIGAKVIEKK